MQFLSLHHRSTKSELLSVEASNLRFKQAPGVLYTLKLRTTDPQCQKMPYIPHAAT